MIESKVDPKGWFRVMCRTVELRNHRANCSNEDNIPPLTKAKEEIGDILLLTEFRFNEDILYQDYNYKFRSKEEMRSRVSGMAELSIMVMACVVGF